MKRITGLSWGDYWFAQKKLSLGSQAGWSLETRALTESLLQWIVQPHSIPTTTNTRSRKCVWQLGIYLVREKRKGTKHLGITRTIWILSEIKALLILAWLLSNQSPWSKLIQDPPMDTKILIDLSTVAFSNMDRQDYQTFGKNFYMKEKDQDKQEKKYVRQTIANSGNKSYILKSLIKIFRKIQHLL